jgi:hypothetical protein
VPWRVARGGDEGEEGSNGYMLIGEEDLEGHLDGRRTWQSFIEIRLRERVKVGDEPAGEAARREKRRRGTSRSVELTVGPSL